MSQPSTIEDIHANLPALRDFAEFMLSKEYETDDWDQHGIDGKVFDFNIYLWEQDGDEVINTVVHTNYIDDNGYWQTDMSTFVPLLQKNLRTGEITDRISA